MKRFILIVLAVVACAISALYWSSRNLGTTYRKQESKLQLSHDHQEAAMEDSKSALERWKLEVGQAESMVPPNDRETRRYSADSQEPNLADGTIHLKGRVWHRDGVSLIDGRADPRSSMIIDASTLKIIEKTGRYESTELVDPN